MIFHTLAGSPSRPLPTNPIEFFLMFRVRNFMFQTDLLFFLERN